MIRLYKEMVHQIIGVMHRFKSQYPRDFDQAWYPEAPLNHTSADLLTLLRKQVEEEPIEPDLVAKMVEILKLPHLSNKVSGRTLKLLREAVLLPSEMTTFTRALETEWECATCEAKFQNGMMAVIVRGENGAVTVRCSNCATPEYAMCPGGRHPVMASRKLRLAWEATQCVECPDCAYTASHPEPEVLTPPPPGAISPREIRVGMPPPATGTATGRSVSARLSSVAEDMRQVQTYRYAAGQQVNMTMPSPIVSSIPPWPYEPAQVSGVRVEPLSAEQYQEILNSPLLDDPPSSDSLDEDYAEDDDLDLEGDE